MTTLCKGMLIGALLCGGCLRGVSPDGFACSEDGRCGAGYTCDPSADRCVTTGDACSDDGQLVSCTPGESGCADGCRVCAEGAWSECAPSPCTDADGDGLGDGTGGNAACLNPTTDSDDADRNVCADTDDDTCDDCTIGVFNPAADGADDDLDGICDPSDTCRDKDGDGLGDGTAANTGCVSPIIDASPDDAHACADTDGDTCDDCNSGTFAPGDDGTDTDENGICDDAPPCNDNDGDLLGNGSDGNISCIDPTTDSADSDANVCADTDADACDDCVTGTFAPDDDGADADADGLCDAGDDCTDVDGDGLGDGTGGNLGCDDPTDDSETDNPAVCSDIDNDTCEDCDSGHFDPRDDGVDTDLDGICDAAPACPDGDGDRVGDGSNGNQGCLTLVTDSADGNPNVCADTDSDGCDDCTSATFAPDQDGADGDGDGVCDATDNCQDQDGDGVGTGVGNNSGCATAQADVDDDDRNRCADVDTDTCDDCSGGGFAPSADGVDSDADGLCNLTDDCNDKDGDGVGTGLNGNASCAVLGNDSNDSIDTLCLDSDGDSCNDCQSGVFDPGDDGVDLDIDGVCDLTDTCVDTDGDGLGDGTGSNATCLDPTDDADDTDDTVCADNDADLCDDCVNGTFDPADDGVDADADGTCDASDDCVDNDDDGVGTGVNGNASCDTPATDTNDQNPNVCTDTDADACNDCVSGSFDPAADGTDSDGDDLCDAGDDCNDADGDGVGTGLGANAACAVAVNDSSDLDGNVCANTDGDLCDDCVSGTFAPADDGPDGDGDTRCDASDTCPGFDDTLDDDSDALPDDCDPCPGREPPGTPCLGSDLNPCNSSCNGAGVCVNAANAAAGTSCSGTDLNQCNSSCNGSGACIEGNNASAEQPCTGSTPDRCDSACNGSGTCNNGGPPACTPSCTCASGACDVQGGACQFDFSTCGIVVTAAPTAAVQDIVPVAIDLGCVGQSPNLSCTTNPARYCIYGKQTFEDETANWTLTNADNPHCDADTANINPALGTVCDDEDGDTGGSGGDVLRFLPFTTATAVLAPVNATGFTDLTIAFEAAISAGTDPAMTPHEGVNVHACCGGGLPCINLVGIADNLDDGGSDVWANRGPFTLLPGTFDNCAAVNVRMTTTTSAVSEVMHIDNFVIAADGALDLSPADNADGTYRTAVAACEATTVTVTCTWDGPAGQVTDSVDIQFN